MRFGMLTVVGFAYATDKNAYWKCKCDCGKETVVRGYSLKSGGTKSCGCMARKTVAERSTKHGLYSTRLYHTYRGIKDRCYNKKCNAYHLYGGRGISICSEWDNDFKAFYDWAMKNGYSDELTIDRIDVNGNYCPENCRFVDMKCQQRNKRSNVYVDYNGRKVCLSELAEILGISRKILHWRYQHGDRGERLFRPVKKYCYDKTQRETLLIEMMKNNPRITYNAMAEETGINRRIVVDIIRDLKERGVVSRQNAGNKSVWVVV